MTRAAFSHDHYGPKRPLRFLKAHYRWQRDAPANTSLSRRVTMVRQGYSASAFPLFGLDQTRREEYLPEIARLDAFFINGALTRELLNDKLRFATFFQGKLPLPATLAVIERGRLFKLGEAGEVTIVDLANEHGSLIIKPTNSSHGHGVYRLEGGQQLKLNGRPTTSQNVRTLVETLDDCIVTEAVQQAAYARSICPASTNTVRVLTFIDPATREPFVANAFHRFGTLESNPIDNWSGGGLLADCSVETGILGASLRNPKFTGGELRRFSHHPDTGVQIEGVQVPGWENICRALLDTVSAYPFLVYVGWDIAVTDKGFTVIEGNNNTDLIMQMHGGLLRNPRIRRFYAHHNVI